VLFPTLTFAVFFTIVYPIAWLVARRPRAWKAAMLAASYVFYAGWDPRFVGLIVASTLVNAAAGRLIARGGPRRARAALVAAVAFDLGLLGAFKYYGFFAESANRALHGLGLGGDLPFLEVILPVGISFFTFQALSYVVDIHRRQLEPVPLLDFAVYLAFFPHLVAGPIVRAAEFLPQLAWPRRLSAEDASYAAILIGRGLFKKVVVSSFLAEAIVDPVFAVPGLYSSPEVLLAIYGYAVQIYADFSGYTDMAIGIALLLGIRFPQNFDRPYGAASIRDFWRRWHMTLSRWLRDYLYIPLGGSRLGPGRTYLNLLVTMALGGLWHGAALTFVAWGVFHGAGLAAERALAGVARGWRPPPAVGTWLGRLVTFHFVCLGWVLFRAQSFADVLEIVSRTVGHWGPAPMVTPAVVGLVIVSLAAQLLPEDFGPRLERGFAGLHPVAQGALLGVFAFVTVALGPEGVAPFIYFQF